jgi:hypothetical protein
MTLETSIWCIVHHFCRELTNGGLTNHAEILRMRFMGQTIQDPSNESWIFGWHEQRPANMFTLWRFIAIENCHVQLIYIYIYIKKWWLSLVVLVFQRVIIVFFLAFSWLYSQCLRFLRPHESYYPPEDQTWQWKNIQLVIKSGKLDFSPFSSMIYLLVNKQNAIENGHRNSWFTH